MPAKAPNKVIGYRYYLGMHMVLCQEVDALLGITAGGRVVLGWTTSLFGTPVDTLPSNWGHALSGSIEDDTYHYVLVDKPDDVTEVQFEETMQLEASRANPPDVVKVYDSVNAKAVWIKKTSWVADTAVNITTLLNTPMDKYQRIQLLLKQSNTPVVPVTSTSTKKFDGFSTLGWTKSQAIQIDKYNLFGGDDRAGGITGKISLLMGDKAQTANEYLSKFFIDSDKSPWCPAFRNCVSLVLERVYMGLTPYIQNWSFLLRRIPFTPDKTTPYLVDSVTGKFSGQYTVGVIQALDHHYDANPAYIIKECIISTKFGMGYPESKIGASFETAAEQLFNEGFGLSFIWDQQSTVTSDFIQSVLNHINGVLYVDHVFATFELKLLRADYVIADLPTLDESNIIKIDSFQRVGWGETINEVVVQYSNRITGDSDAVTVQDLANVQIQGAVVSTTKVYKGIHDSSLAARVAQRDLQTLSTPLSKIRLTANRQASKFRAGDVFKLHWEKLDISSVVYRVGATSAGTLNNGSVTIEAVEDVFALPFDSYLGMASTPVVSESLTKTPIRTYFIYEMSFFELVAYIGLQYAKTQDITSAWVIGAAKRPYAHTDYFAFEVTGSTIPATVNLDDYTGFDSVATNGYYSPTALITSALDPEVASFVEVHDMSLDWDSISTGDYGYIEQEMVVITSISSDKRAIHINRGIFDTCPVFHPAEALLILTSKKRGIALWEYAKSDKVTAFMRPHYRTDTLARSICPRVELNLIGRAALPYPPGNLQVSNLPFANKTFVHYPKNLNYGDIRITWSHRNRIQQTVGPLAQDKGNISSEDGAVYEVVLTESLGTDSEKVIFTLAYIFDPSVYCPYTLLTKGKTYTLSVWSVCNGLYSYQANTATFTLGNDSPTQISDLPSNCYTVVSGINNPEVMQLDSEATTLANISGNRGTWVLD